MGILRTLSAWLAAASTVGLVIGLPHVTLADDAGPGKEVRAIRHDLPILLAGRLSSHESPKDVTVDGVVVGTHGVANAEWHSPTQHRIVEFVRADGLWFLHTEWTPLDGERLGDVVSPAGTGGAKTAIDFSADSALLDDLDGYQMAVRFARNDAPAGAQLAQIHGRAPTEAESWVTRGGNSYFFFSGAVQSPAPVHVDAGTTIDVWFPFVLDDRLHYAITIGHTEKPIGPLEGKLENNVVHFVLPAFDIAPGATLMAEIEGDSFRQE